MLIPRVILISLWKADSVSHDPPRYDAKELEPAEVVVGGLSTGRLTPYP